MFLHYVIHCIIIDLPGFYFCCNFVKLVFYLDMNAYNDESPNPSHFPL